MSLKPLKKSDLGKDWLHERSDIKRDIRPEYHLIVTEGKKTEPPRKRISHMTQKRTLTATKHYPELKPVKTRLIGFDPLRANEINTALNKSQTRRRQEAAEARNAAHTIYAGK